MSDTYTIDLHVHARESNQDAEANAADMVAAAKRAGLDGLCILAQVVPDQLRQDEAVRNRSAEDNANALRQGYDAACAAGLSMPDGPRVYFGLEYRIPKTVDDIIVLGLDPGVLGAIDLVRADPWDVRRFAIERGGVLCAAHPYRHRAHGAPFGGPNMVDAVEVINGRRCFNNRNDLAVRWCQRIGGVPLAGSDAHNVNEVGEAATRFKSLPDSSHALAAAVRKKLVDGLEQRRFLWLGLQSCRFNGLFIEDELRHTARQGLSSFEVFFDGFLPADIDGRSRSRIASMASGMGLALYVLAPASPLNGRAGQSLLNDLVDFAVELNAQLLIVPAMSLVDMELAAQLCSSAADRALRVAISNAPVAGRNCDVDQLVKVTSALPHAQVALDIGYAHLFDDAAHYTGRLLTALNQVDRHIVHIQLHDNDGVHDEHLSMGQGTLPLKCVFELLFAAGYNGAGIIEHWRDPRFEVEQIVALLNDVHRSRFEVDLDRLAELPVPLA